MKQFCAIIISALLIAWLGACEGGSSHSDETNPGAIVDYDEMEVFPCEACGYHADAPEHAWDGNEESATNIYDPVFSGWLKIEFPCEDKGPVKEQEFWALLHGNGNDVIVKELDGTDLATVNPPAKGWFRFLSNDADWAEGICFCCDGGEQLLVFEVYKIVTYRD